MRGKLTFAPFDENFDCFYTDVSIGILPYDYEICIKQPLDKSFGSKNHIFCCQAVYTFSHVCP